jgi:signal transduction histidine kinase
VPGSAAPDARAAAAHLAPLVNATADATLASILLLAPDGRILIGENEGRSLAGLPELAEAARGRPETVLRRRGDYHPEYALEWLSRASGLRIHHARPVVVNGKVVAVLLLSRSPRALFRGLYEDRGKILFGIGAIFATLVVLSGLLSRGIARPIEMLSQATRDVARGGGTVPEVPRTAAIEIQALYADFATMADAIDRRSRYLRDFAHAVSHEFKTPLAGIRGVIEILEDHHAEMNDADRRRFLANAGADADRLAQLVTRLLELARADMAETEASAAADVATALRRIADAWADRGLAIALALPDGLSRAAMPGAMLEAIVESLVENSRQAGAGSVRMAVTETDGEILLTDRGRRPRHSGSRSRAHLRALFHQPARRRRHRPGPAHRPLAARLAWRNDRAGRGGTRNLFRAPRAFSSSRRLAPCTARLRPAPWRRGPADRAVGQRARTGGRVPASAGRPRRDRHASAPAKRRFARGRARRRRRRRRRGR